MDHSILKMDVFQHVFQLGLVRASDHLAGWCEGHFEYEVVVQCMRVENSVVCQDLVVQIDSIFSAVRVFFQRRRLMFFCPQNLSGSCTNLRSGCPQAPCRPAYPRARKDL